MRISDWSSDVCSSDLAVANDDIGTSVEDRRDDPGYVFADILPVGVGVDDDVGARGERRIDARAERRGKAAIGAVAHDMVRTHMRATCAVLSVLPSSVTNISVVSTPSILRGLSASGKG